MSNQSIIGIIVIVVILGVGGYMLTNRHTTVSDTTSTTMPTPTATGTGMSSNTDNSDAALAQDMTSVDTQMNGLNSDSVSADEGLNNSNQ